MDYFLIKGHFHVVKYSPDGDSLMFKAENPKHWDLIQSEFRAEFETNFASDEARVQLRLQGVDALETHYSPMPLPAPKEVGTLTFSGAIKPVPGRFKQPQELAAAATEKLLSILGVSKSTWTSTRQFIQSIEVKKGTATETFSEKGKDGLPGYIVVNDIEQKGRPISWVFAGAPAVADGSQIPSAQLEKILKTSANYQ
ncbi:MAG: hypothetical protein EAZ89_13970, partial [Bacteroidetes bacterium]